MASTALDSEASELLLSIMVSVQNDEKFEPAKVRKSGEIGNGSTHFLRVMVEPFQLVALCYYM